MAVNRRVGPVRAVRRVRGLAVAAMKRDSRGKEVMRLEWIQQYVETEDWKWREEGSWKCGW